METTESQVARFIAQRIVITGKQQNIIAKEAGFEKPNIITMLKQGKTRLPLERVGPMAKALETDPVYLLQLCMKEYTPETWNAIEPYLDSAMTEDERKLLCALRAWVGGPFLAALNSESRIHFDNFIRSLRTSTTVQ
jgi:hypothetical protein